MEREETGQENTAERDQEVARGSGDPPHYGTVRASGTTTIPPRQPDIEKGPTLSSRPWVYRF